MPSNTSNDLLDGLIVHLTRRAGGRCPPVAAVLGEAAASGIEATEYRVASRVFVLDAQGKITAPEDESWGTLLCEHFEG